MSYTFESDGIYYREIQGCLEIVDIRTPCAKKEIVITNEINGVPITSIGQKAFFNVSELEEVYLPNNIEKIGYQAFAYCENLKSVRLQSGGGTVLKIDYSAFRGCTNLLRFCTDKLIKMQDGAFEDCINLISFDAAITGKIPPCAFLNCQQLRMFTFNQEITEIGVHAFTKCNNLLDFYVDDYFKYDDEFATLLRRGKIWCNKDSKFVDLAYEGYNVNITGW